MIYLFPLFEYSKVFQRHLRYKDYWQEILKTKIEIFANPYDFINDISEQIVELVTDDIAENWNIDKYLLRYLILKEFANNEKWQNELIEKIRKNG